MTDTLVQPALATGLGDHLLSTSGLGVQQITQLFERAEWISRSERECGGLLLGRRLGSLFYQNSTRTKFSFHAAVQLLGGSVIGFDDVRTTRSGDFFQETLRDTVGVIGQYVDALVLRHPEDHAADVAACSAPVPVINAGDGANEHPTQALLDTWILIRALGDLGGRTIGLVGDPTCRDFRSLIQLLATMGVSELVSASPSGCRLDADQETELDAAALRWTEVDGVRDLLGRTDAVCMLPIQLPSFHLGTAEEGAPATGAERRLCMTRDLLTSRPAVPVLHVGPRGPELPPEVDDLAQVQYRTQARAGMHLRAAIVEGLVHRRESDVAR